MRVLGLDGRDQVGARLETMFTNASTESKSPLSTSPLGPVTSAPTFFIVPLSQTDWLPSRSAVSAATT